MSFSETIEDDGYDAAKNSYGCWELWRREMRLEGIRAGKFSPRLDDTEEMEAAREAGFMIVQAEAHRRSA